MLFSFSYKAVLFSFLKLLQKKGKKEKAELCLNLCLSYLKKYEKKKPLLFLTDSFYRSKPFCELKKVQISGTTYNLPVEIKSKRQKSIFFRWLLISSSKISSPSVLSNNIAKELISAFNFSGKTVKLCDNYHKTAESNKSYINYRF